MAPARAISKGIEQHGVIEEIARRAGAFAHPVFSKQWLACACGGKIQRILRISHEIPWRVIAPAASETAPPTPSAAWGKTP